MTKNVHAVMPRCDEPRHLLDLPTDILSEAFVRCDMETLQQIQRTCVACHSLARQTVTSKHWCQRSQVNAQAAALSKLECGLYSSRALKGLEGGVRDLSMAANGQLACGTKDSRATVWDLATGQADGDFQHPQWVGAVSVDGHVPGWLATGCDDGIIRIWHSRSDAYPAMPSQEPTIELRGDSRSWVIGVGWMRHREQSFTSGELRSCDVGRLPPLVSCSRDGELVLWDVGERCRLGGEYNHPVAEPGARSSVLVTAFDSSADVVAIGRVGQGPRHGLSETEELVICRVSDERTLSTHARLAPRSGSTDRGPVVSLAFDRGEAAEPSGQVSTTEDWPGLASGSTWGLVHLWDLRSPRSIATLENGCAGSIRSLAYCGRLLLAGRDPGPLVNVWDLRTRRIVQKLRGHTNNDALAAGVDGERAWLACGGRMNELRMWEVHVGA